MNTLLRYSIWIIRSQTEASVSQREMVFYLCRIRNFTTVIIAIVIGTNNKSIFIVFITQFSQFQIDFRYSTSKVAFEFSGSSLEDG